MVRNQAASFRLVLTAVDAAVIVLTWLGVTALRHFVGELWTIDLLPGERILRPLAVAHNLAHLVLVLPVWLYALHRGGTYDDLRRMRFDILLLRLARASMVALLGMLGLSFALQVGTQLSRTLIAGFGISVVLTLFGARVVLLRAFRARARKAWTHNIVLVGSLDEAVPLIQTLRRHDNWGMKLIGVVRSDDGQSTEVSGATVLGRVEDLPRILERHAVDEVMVAGSSLSVATLRMVADSCEELGVRFSMDANFLGLTISRAQLTDLDGWHVLSFASTPEDAEGLAVKRAMDVALSALALLGLSPVFLFTALAIKLEDGGPIFFGQERSGLYGRTFTMWKFRSMVTDAEKRKAELERLNEMQGPVFKIKHDPRITRIGRLIRKTSIDELPQFWNVLNGSMSLVGPRPPLPSEVEKYERWQRRRLSMKPGITCIWQVSGRNNIDFETWMKLDLEYIDNWSLFLDVKLLARTVPVVLLGHGAS
jgi:exopolysaccharide biosynthesis polyprenyl glycosylphosphotransferase